jgi:uncharacterized protein
MKIRLNEIPQDGRRYDFDRQTGELNADLQDLIGDRDYQVEFEIKPIGNAYEMRGSLKTTLPEVCSTCGYDFELPIEKRINEILFEELEDTRKAQSVHGNQSVDFGGQGPAMVPVKGDVFDPGAYTHEVVALAEPFYPICGVDGNCEHRDEVEEIKRKLEADFALAEAEKPVGHPGFAALKELNLKN